MMSDTMRWGVLGASDFARRHMAPAIHAAHGAELAALATSSAAKAKGFQDFAPGIQIFDDYDALLNDPGIDAIYIPLPNHLHVEWSCKAMEAGKHVLCEKPMGLTAADYDTLISCRDRTGVLAAEAFMITHHPQFLRARQLVQEGAIGRVVFVDSTFSFDNREAVGNIRNRPETGGGGLYDIGVYTFGAARFVTGEEPLRIRDSNLTIENGVDVFAQVSAEFDSFAYSGTVSMRMFNSQHITFTGESGRIHLNCPYNANVHDLSELTLEQGGQTKTVERWTSVNQYVEQVQNFGHSVRDGVPYGCPLEFSKGTAAMIDMVRAAATG